MTTQTPTNTKPVAWNTINECGAFVCNWSGHLIRVPQNAINGGTPWITFEANETPFVTKLSDDCQIPVSEARQIAENLNVTVKF